MERKRAARRSDGYDAPSNVFTLAREYANSIAYEHGTWQAGLALCAMFLALGLGSVVFGW